MIKLFNKMGKEAFFYTFICILLLFGQVKLELKIPDYMSEITRLVQTDGSLISDVLKQGCFMLGCALLSLIFSIIVGFFASLIASTFSKDLREKIFSKVLDMGITEIDKFSTSSLITRTTNDVTQIEMLIAMGLQVMVKSPIMAISAIMKILNKGFEWSILVAGCVLILLLVVTIVLIIVLPRFKIVQKLIDVINGVTRENLSGIRVIRAFNAIKYQTDKFNKVNDKLTRMQLFNQSLFQVLYPTINLIMYGLVLGIYTIGALLIEKAGMLEKITLFSDMVVFSNYGMNVIMSFLMLSVIIMMLPRAFFSANRINEVLDEKISIIDGDGTFKTDKVGEIEFQHVSFKYPDADDYVLKDISFKVKQGETIAFIGSTGSGKSTLINLVPRFYDVTDGEILVDGINIKEYKQKELYNKIGYVSQKAFMFTGSVASNVSYGSKTFSKKEIMQAIDIAQGSDFVNSMDNKYDSHIARGGTNISGGQKQRLSIARAIVRNPEIYIFDDSFSALDYKTDLLLRKELKKHTKEATILIVAQRIGTIIHADKIMVLNEGECIGMGTHKELLKSCEVYKQIALSQLSEEELKNA